jgi:hypothetical protein
MTLSVGCRAPSASELVARIAENLSQSVAEKANRRYTDPALLQEPNERGMSLSKSVKEDMKQLVREAVEELLDNEIEWDELVGSAATEPKRFIGSLQPSFENEYIEQMFKEHNGDLGEFLNKIGDGKGVLRRSGGISFATSAVSTPSGDLIYRIYASGGMWEIWNDKHASKVFQRIEQGLSVTGEMVAKSSLELRQLLEDWIDDGLLSVCIDKSSE